MLKRVRESLRQKLGRALHEYVVLELRRDADANRAAVQAAVDAAVDAAVGRVESSMRAWERRQRRDLFTATEQHAASTSARFMEREMSRATPWFVKSDTLAAAVKASPAEGLYLEFGVHTGGTLRQIVEMAPAGSVYGFDSFEGLPEDWRMFFAAGTFGGEEIPEVPGAELVVGWFDQTLPGFLAEHPEPVAFLHLDADLYSSTVTVLEALEDRLRPGTVLLFDEYFNFPGWEAHEHRAWTEFVARTGLSFEYLGFTADDEQLSLRITAMAGREPGA